MDVGRRELLAGFGAVLAATAMPRFAEAAAPGSWVLYVSAGNCPFCRTIDTYYKPDFIRGLQRQGIEFRNVQVTTYHNSRAEEDWPADLRWVLQAMPNMRGTPHLLLINGRTIVDHAYGLSGFKGKFAPLAGMSV